MGAANQEGLLHSIRRLPGIALGVLRNRVELLAIEWEEERVHWTGTLLLVVAIAVFSLMALVMLTLTVLLAFNHEHRLAAAAVITGLYALIAIVGAVYLRKRLKNWSSFSATREELRKDSEWLEQKDPNP